MTTFQPDEVAKKLVDDSLCGAWSSTVGLEGFMLTTLCAGMGPITDAASFVAQVGVFSNLYCKVFTTELIILPTKSAMCSGPNAQW